VVKAHSLEDFVSIRVARYDSPVLCVSSSIDDLFLAAGTAAGRLDARVRLAAKPHHKLRRQPLAPPPGTYRHFQRGKAYQPRGVDVLAVADILPAPASKKPKLQPYDEALRKFRYGDALDAALATRDPAVVLAVLAQLDRRGGLHAALANRDEDRLEPLLAFLAAHVATPPYAARLIPVVHLALDQYRSALGARPAIDELFNRIALNLARETDAQRALLRLSGTVRALAATVSSPPEGPAAGGV